ncbi:hypothetical protein CPB84DRAFT_1800299 [Gymnopilus junonius]|uniref:Uncharacterized protein n=1 Tax=Gymnopilus junonius TaxID=109634 RepID=A0A9P5N7E7_GYMJU|nr:hypothetical protein CPB84DRAFT_1800299 [Gymnopilus junonius]
MRYDSVLTLNNSTSVLAGQKTDEISLDLSSRSKIVIRPLLQRQAPSIATGKAVIPGRSIFSSKSNKKTDAESPVVDARHPEPAKSVLKASRTSSHSTTPPKRDRSSGPARDGKLEKAKLAKAHATVEKRVRIAEPSETVVTTLPCPKPAVSCPAACSPYAEECAKCDCTVNGAPPCQRCQLLLLADKFCDLVYQQCERWNIQI